MLLELLAELYLCVIMRTKDYDFLEVSMKLKKIRNVVKPSPVLKKKPYYGLWY